MTRATRNDHRLAVQALGGPAWLRSGKNVSLGCRQIKISVIGRKSGLTISIPVWFVLEGNKLYLLPVQGSDTQWYRNVLQNPSIRIDARVLHLPAHKRNAENPKLLRRVQRIDATTAAGNCHKFERFPSGSTTTVRGKSYFLLSFKLLGVVDWILFEPVFIARPADVFPSTRNDARS